VTIERGSDKHSPRLDDQLEHDVRSLVQGGVEARAEEFREQEGPADGEPTPDERITALDGGADALSERADLARRLRPSTFPARPEQLAVVAREEGAPDDLVDRIRALPDRLYDTVAEVWEAMGGDVESRTTTGP
jgi:hypothetical protein